MKKRKAHFDPLNNLVLDKEEQEIEDALDRNEYVPVKNFAKRKKELEEMAGKHIELRKTKRITLRVKNEDLIKVKSRAERVNIPYQRLLNVLIHKYAEGETTITI